MRTDRQTQRRSKSNNSISFLVSPVGRKLDCKEFLSACHTGRLWRRIGAQAVRQIILKFHMTELTTNRVGHIQIISIYKIKTMAFKSKTMAFKSKTIAFKSKTMAFKSKTMAFKSKTMAFKSKTMAFKRRKPIRMKTVHEIGEDINTSIYIGYKQSHERGSYVTKQINKIFRGNRNYEQCSKTFSHYEYTTHWQHGSKTWTLREQHNLQLQQQRWKFFFFF